MLIRERVLSFRLIVEMADDFSAGFRTISQVQRLFNVVDCYPVRRSEGKLREKIFEAKGASTRVREIHGISKSIFDGLLYSSATFPPGGEHLGGAAN